MDALGADQQAGQISAGGGAGGFRVMMCVRAGRGAGRSPYLSSLAVADGFMAGPTSRDPAAEGGEFKGLGEMAQGKSLAVEGRFQGPARTYRLRPGRWSRRVDFDDIVEAGQVQAEKGAEHRFRLQAADHARSAAEGDDRCAEAGGRVQDVPDLGMALPDDNGVGGESIRPGAAG